MGSFVPIIDLNAYPIASHPPPISALDSSAAAASAFPPLKLPKIEPKPEPFDEPMEIIPPPFPPLPSDPSPSSHIFLNAQTAPPAPLPPPPSPAEQSHVFSEFHRISELFNTAFSKGSGGLQNCNGSGGGGGDSDENNNGVVLNPETGAIVAVEEQRQVAEVASPQRKKYPQRSNELVRVTDLGEEDHRYFREVVRKTRMLYDAIRILAVAEAQRKNPGLGRRVRGDLRASTVLRDHGLWLNRDKRIVGSIPGVYVGDVFLFRMELCVVGIHGQTQAGIDYLTGSQSSNREPIATSIIVSGGYEDDEDGGDVIIYTGHGGQDMKNKQCAHQKLEGGNLALERSMHYGIEVRVIRGFKTQSPVSSKVYVYDGLYRILETWLDVGKSGFGVFKFKLLRIEGQPEMGSVVLKFAASLMSNPLTVRPRGYLSMDLSQNKETAPVLLFNDIDSDKDPLYYDYLKMAVFPTHVYQQSAHGTGCDCVGESCSENCLCAMKNGGIFPYDHNGLLMRGKPVIFECGIFCRCSSKCQNRVAQKGLQHRLEVFRSRETGWGVRPLNLIHAGTFICEYTGVILTREQAQIFSMDGDSLIYPQRFSERWTEWGDLSQIYPDYVRPSYPPIPPLDFAMDVSKMRNVACYMSQSTSPNVMVQLVLYDHSNLMFPHLMLFAMENIPPMRELSLDYGVAEAWTPNLAICN